MVFRPVEVQMNWKTPRLALVPHLERGHVVVLKGGSPWSPLRLCQGGVH